MKKLIINGKIAIADGCETIITVVGPNGYNHQESKEGNFNIPLDINSGLYSINIHGITDGVLTINITGNLINIDPKVPMNLTNNFSQIFHVNL